MADEITMYSKLSFASTDDSVTEDLIEPAPATVDKADNLFVKEIISVGTAEEVISFGEVASPRVFFLRNNDPTNFIQWGPESASTMVVLGKLLPGEESGPIPIDPTVVIRAKADTAACEAMVVVL